MGTFGILVTIVLLTSSQDPTVYTSATSAAHIKNGTANNVWNTSKDALMDGLAKGPVPYQVSVQAKTGGREHEHLCAGTIVDESFVVTAAHCFYKYGNPNDLSVVGGSNHLDTVKGHRHRVTGLAIHEKYVPLYGSDIALLRVHPKFEGKHFAKVNFTATGNIEGGVDAFLIGWGRLTIGVDRKLELVSFRTLDSNLCKKRRFRYVTSTEVCAVSYKGRGACDGDSGGPLMSADLSFQIGILSYGKTPCMRGRIYAFTRLQPMVPWIRKTMNYMARLP